MTHPMTKAIRFHETGGPEVLRLGAARLEGTVGVGGLGQRELLPRLPGDAPGQHVAEQLVGHGQHVRGDITGATVLVP